MALLDGIGNFLFGGNAANKAMPYLNQIPGQAHQSFDPYIQQGQQAGSEANALYSRMSQDPQAFLNEIMKGYTPSEGFQFKKGQLGKELSNTAAAGGFSGTENDQISHGELLNQLLSGDMQQWLSNVLGVQGAGLSGQQHVADTGFQGTEDLASILTNALNQQAGLAYQGQAQRNQNQANLFGNIARGTTAGYFGGPEGILSAFGGRR